MDTAGRRGLALAHGTFSKSFAASSDPDMQVDALTGKNREVMAMELRVLEREAKNEELVTRLQHVQQDLSRQRAATAAFQKQALEACQLSEEWADKWRRMQASRKIRRTAQDEQDFVPLVPGARATTEEAILNSFTGETTEQKREQGEDYWVDPNLVQVEQSAKQRALKVREEFVKGKDNFQEERLRQEIVAPYKNNVIVYVVAGFGAIAVLYAVLPGLFETNVGLSVGTFPDKL